MSGKALLSKQRQARRALLTKIYEPALRLQKGSLEYAELASSGRIWEDYFRPGNSLEKGYVGFQQEHKRMLDEIDALKASLPTAELGKTMVSEYAQQSVMIENNHLTVRDAKRILESLQTGVFRRVDLASTSSSELATIVTSETEGGTDSATNELRNHIVASQWIAEGAAAKARTAGLREDEVRDLAVVCIRNTESEAAYEASRGGYEAGGPKAGTLVWGARVPLGKYRNLPIAVRSNRLRIFPYPQEVPACVARFFEWRDTQHREKALHPLVLACQMTAYFVHVHPFPVVIPGLERKDYLRMIDDACEGKPGELVAAVVEAQQAALHMFSTRCPLTDNLGHVQKSVCLGDRAPKGWVEKNPKNGSCS